MRIYIYLPVLWAFALLNNFDKLHMKKIIFNRQLPGWNCLEVVANSNEIILKKRHWKDYWWLMCILLFFISQAVVVVYFINKSLFPLFAVFGGVAAGMIFFGGLLSYDGKPILCYNIKNNLLRSSIGDESFGDSIEICYFYHIGPTVRTAQTNYVFIHNSKTKRSFELFQINQTKPKRNLIHEFCNLTAIKETFFSSADENLIYAKIRQYFDSV